MSNEDIEELENRFNDNSIDMELANKAIELYNKIHSEEFVEKMKTIYSSIHGDSYIPYDFEREIENYMFKELENKENRAVLAERKFKKILEETRRMLLTLFYLVDCIKDGSTHYEKNSFTRTALHVLRKQIKFFDEIKEDQSYIQSFFSRQFNDGYETVNIVTYDSLQHRLEKHENKIKELETKNYKLKKRIFELDGEEFTSIEDYQEAFLKKCVKENPDWFNEEAIKKYG